SPTLFRSAVLAKNLRTGVERLGNVGTNQCRSRLRMSIFQRIATIFGAKSNKTLDKAENPNETHDYSYQKQLELLQQVRRGVADDATSRKRRELQMNQREQQQDKLSGQAQKAMEIGREDLAREALTRKSGLTQQINVLQSQHEGLQGEEQKLTLASQRLQA